MRTKSKAFKLYVLGSTDSLPLLSVTTSPVPLLDTPNLKPYLARAAAIFPQGVSMISKYPTR